MNISCINLYNELEKNIFKISLDGLNYLFKNTSCNVDGLIYTWSNHSRIGKCNYYDYIYSHRYNIIWYPYAKHNAIKIFSNVIKFTGSEILMDMTNNLNKILINKFKILGGVSSWEERIEYVLYTML